MVKSPVASQCDFSFPCAFSYKIDMIFYLVTPIKQPKFLHPLSRNTIFPVSTDNWSSKKFKVYLYIIYPPYLYTPPSGHPRRSAQHRYGHSCSGSSNPLPTGNRCCLRVVEGAGGRWRSNLGDRRPYLQGTHVEIPRGSDIFQIRQNLPRCLCRRAPRWPHSRVWFLLTSREPRVRCRGQPLPVECSSVWHFLY